MTRTETFNASVKWKYFNIELVMSPNTSGRFVYMYVMSRSSIFIKELEVFAPFSFGEYENKFLPCVTHD